LRGDDIGGGEGGSTPHLIPLPWGERKEKGTLYPTGERGRVRGIPLLYPLCL